MVSLAFRSRFEGTGIATCFRRLENSTRGQYAQRVMLPLRSLKAGKLSPNKVVNAVVAGSPAGGLTCSTLYGCEIVSDDGLVIAPTAAVAKLSRRPFQQWVALELEQPSAENGSHARVPVRLPARLVATD
jgi:hypothetical protein